MIQRTEFAINDPLIRINGSLIRNLCVAKTCIS